LLAWADRPRRSYALLAGLAVGVGVWTYQPLKLTPLLVVAWLLWLRHSNRPLFDRLWTDRLWLLLGYAVALAPYLWTALSDPINYFGRIAGVSPLAPAMRRTGFLTHTLDTLGMFFVAGDPNPRHDISALPVLLWPLPLLGALGLWYAVRRRHDPAHGLVLAALGVFLLPALIALEGDAPHLQRSLALAPYIAGLLGLGLVELVRLARPAGRALAIAAAAAGAIALLLTGTYGGLAFAFRPVTERYAAFDYHVVSLAAAGAQPHTAVIVNPYDEQTVRFLDGPAVSIYPPGADVPGDVALAALSRDDFPAARRAAATVYARDPSGNPAVWIAPPYS
jgi:4-amino-4-deoxy-L-arabinose transferase-like glycosyltransferase